MNILLILFSVGPFSFKQKWQQETMLTMEHPRFVHRKKVKFPHIKCTVLPPQFPFLWQLNYFVKIFHLQE